MHMRAMVEDTNFILETTEASLLGIKTIAANVGVGFHFVSGDDAPREVHHTPVKYNMPKLFLAIDGGSVWNVIFIDTYRCVSEEVVLPYLGCSYLIDGVLLILN